ncbi:MAG: alpha/beta hydrolase [Deltaproteobacteria bacterium]|nr:alpha/beta hydrolase [Deltaproteobacteria bacterium]
MAGSIDITIHRDIPYAIQSEAQKLDIYLIPKREKPCPVIMWIHPGGFHDGDKDGSANPPLAVVNMIRLIQPMLERGYAVVSINYRLSQEAVFPALIFDVKAAVRWIRANAADYNFHPEKIAAWGSSAGGYLAAMLATTNGVKELDDLSLGNQEQSGKVLAAVDWFGPTHFLHMDAQHEQLGQEADVHDPESPESRLMGAPVMTIPEKCDAASPVTYVNQDSSPVFIQQGTGDPVIPYPQSIMLAEKMAAAIGEENVSLELVKDAGHADPVFFSLENVHKVIDFIDRYMK